mmetsp:Transcript_3467/g.10081  ORF Transcript_3467/g.10081 Transcript_3467/m.10081 type:complete len:314 (-) Transcript_3467:369-1310(-)
MRHRLRPRRVSHPSETRRARTGYLPLYVWELQAAASDATAALATASVSTASTATATATFSTTTLASSSITATSAIPAAHATSALLSAALGSVTLAAAAIAIAAATAAVPCTVVSGRRRPGRRAVRVVARVHARRSRGGPREWASHRLPRRPNSTGRRHTHGRVRPARARRDQRVGAGGRLRARHDDALSRGGTAPHRERLAGPHLGPRRAERLCRRPQRHGGCARAIRARRHPRGLWPAVALAQQPLRRGGLLLGGRDRRVGAHDADHLLPASGGGGEHALPGLGRGVDSHSGRTAARGLRQPRRAHVERCAG